MINQDEIDLLPEDPGVPIPRKLLASIRRRAAAQIALTRELPEVPRPVQFLAARPDIVSVVTGYAVDYHRKGVREFKLYHHTDQEVQNILRN